MRVVDGGEREPDLGDLVVVVLADTLIGLRDALANDGFDPAAELVADLVELTGDYLHRRGRWWWASSLASRGRR